MTRDGYRPPSLLPQSLKGRLMLLVDALMAAAVVGILILCVLAIYTLIWDVIASL